MHFTLLLKVFTTNKLLQAYFQGRIFAEDVTNFYNYFYIVWYELLFMVYNALYSTMSVFNLIYGVAQNLKNSVIGKVLTFHNNDNNNNNNKVTKHF